jgi:hypothetical protein
MVCFLPVHRFIPWVRYQSQTRKIFLGKKLKTVIAVPYFIAIITDSVGG